MESIDKNAIISALLQLCEKQYRKGFQQGFYACLENRLSRDQVNRFRWDGEACDYKAAIDPHNGRPISLEELLINELCGMRGAEQLKDLLNGNNTGLLFT